MRRQFSSLAEKLEAFTDRSGGPDACWEWMRCRTRYGFVMWEGKTYLTHRAAWMVEHGEIPKGMNVCHSCDNPACINPAHLWLGTQSQNIRDCVAKGRYVVNTAPRLGEQNNWAKVTEDQVCEMRARFRQGEQKKVIAKDFGMSPTNAGDIIRGITWKHVRCGDDYV